MGDSPCVLAHRALIEVEKERLLRSRVAETHSMDTAMGQAVPEGVCGERLCFPSLRDNTTGQTNPKAGGVQGPPMGCGAVHLAVTSKWQAYLLAHRHSGWHGYCRPGPFVGLFVAEQSWPALQHRAGRTLSSHLNILLEVSLQIAGGRVHQPNDKWQLPIPKERDMKGSIFC